MFGAYWCNLCNTYHPHPPCGYTEQLQIANIIEKIKELEKEIAMLKQQIEKLK